MSYFATDAILETREGSQRGLEAIERWHQQRFEAKMAVITIESVEDTNDGAAADLVITSDRLSGRRLENLPIRLNISLSNGKITTARLQFRMGAGLKSLFGLGRN
jgi:hypothetical protein